MKPIPKIYGIVFAVVAMVLFAACSESVDHRGKTPLVGVGDEFLYKEDVQKMLSSSRMVKDSAEFVKEYVEHWLEDVLLYNQAKRNVASSKEVDRLIENYRKSLLLNIYQERLVDQQLDKRIMPDEIAAFYESNKAMFKMEEPMVRGLLLKVSKKAPRLDAVRKWCKSDKPEDMERLEKYTHTNAQIYEYFNDDWMPLSALAAKMSLSNDELCRKVEKEGMFEYSDSASIYMLNVAGYLPLGGVKPLDLAEHEIKELLVNSRKAGFLRSVKRDIYNNALEDGDVKYYDEALSGR